MKHIRFGRWFR